MTTTSEHTRLNAHDLTLAYEQHVVSDNLHVTIPDNSFTVIVGPNACGKSTLLRDLSRTLKPTRGAVHLDGNIINSYAAKEVARRLGLLPQSSIAPDGIGVADLVSRGRYPHQGFLRQWSRTDEEVVAHAMDSTGITALADRSVDELSGGQRQRVWLAMVLAQQTPCSCWTSPPPTSTSPTRWTCSTCVPNCTPNVATRLSPSCTTSTTPPATPPTSSS